MTILKLIFSLTLSMLLFSCGGGGGNDSRTLIGVSDEDTSASIGSDLSLTVRVDPGQASGFTTKVGPEGATIFLNSGQRIEISSDRPAALQIEAHGATVTIADVNDSVWSGEIVSPIRTSVRFLFSPIDNPERPTPLTVNVLP